MLSFVIPTRNRPRELALTLDRLAALSRADTGRGGEVIVVDNASNPPVRTSTRLANGLAVTLLRENENRGAAARNVAAAAARGQWLVMLDDDSAPLVAPFASVLSGLDDDIAAVGGEIMLPTGAREAGGLPEVVVGCGCAVRREAFLAVGGYDEAFGYYVEEYDLCAKLIAAGHRVVHTRDLSFLHRKMDTGRSFASILHRLVRNNGWTIRRYAPDDRYDAAQAAMRERYRAIAEREGVADAFQDAIDELDRTIARQPRRPLSASQWDRFVGAHAVRTSLVPELRAAGVDAVRIVEPGKGVDVILEVLRAAGIADNCGAGVHACTGRSCTSECRRGRLHHNRSDAPADFFTASGGLHHNKPDALAVVGTLSPGPMLDAAERSRGIARCAWHLDGRRAPHASGSDPFRTAPPAAGCATTRTGSVRA